MTSPLPSPPLSAPPLSSPALVARSLHPLTCAFRINKAPALSNYINTTSPHTRITIANPPTFSPTIKGFNSHDSTSYHCQHSNTIFRHTELYHLKPLQHYPHTISPLHHIIPLLALLYFSIPATARQVDFYLGSNCNILTGKIAAAAQAFRMDWGKKTIAKRTFVSARSKSFARPRSSAK